MISNVKTRVCRNLKIPTSPQQHRRQQQQHLASACAVSPGANASSNHRDTANATVPERSGVDTRVGATNKRRGHTKECASDIGASYRIKTNPPICSSLPTPVRPDSRLLRHPREHPFTNLSYPIPWRFVPRRNKCSPCLLLSTITPLRYIPIP